MKALDTKKKPSRTPTEYVSLIRWKFANAGDPVRAEGQMKYMRNKFAYYGLKAPVWVSMLKEVFKEQGMFSGRDLQAFATLCFNE